MRIVGLLALAILLPVCAYAAALVNINTANATLLDTLPGIGPSKAAAIVDYRTTHGPFATVGGIQNVKGIGSGSTYAKIAPLITVGDTGVSDPIVQPSVPTKSLNTVQAVKPASPIISPTTNIQQHDEAVSAPADATELAAAGAALPPATGPRAGGLLHSPWTLGLFGVIVLAGSVFIFL